MTKLYWPHRDRRNTDSGENNWWRFTFFIPPPPRPPLRNFYSRSDLGIDRDATEKNERSPARRRLGTRPTPRRIDYRAVVTLWRARPAPPPPPPTHRARVRLLAAHTVGRKCQPVSRAKRARLVRRDRPQRVGRSLAYNAHSSREPFPPLPPPPSHTANGHEPPQVIHVRGCNPTTATRGVRRLSVVGPSRARWGTTASWKCRWCRRRRVTPTAAARHPSWSRFRGTDAPRTDRRRAACDWSVNRRRVRPVAATTAPDPAARRARPTAGSSSSRRPSPTIPRAPARLRHRYGVGRARSLYSFRPEGDGRYAPKVPGNGSGTRLFVVRIY